MVSIQECDYGIRVQCLIQLSVADPAGGAPGAPPPLRPLQAQK